MAASVVCTHLAQVGDVEENKTNVVVLYDIENKLQVNRKRQTTYINDGP